MLWNNSRYYKEIINVENTQQLLPIIHSFCESRNFENASLGQIKYIPKTVQMVGLQYRLLKFTIKHGVLANVCKWYNTLYRHMPLFNLIQIISIIVMYESHIYKLLLIALTKESLNTLLGKYHQLVLIFKNTKNRTKHLLVILPTNIDI